VAPGLLVLAGIEDAVSFVAGLVGVSAPTLAVLSHARIPRLAKAASVARRMARCFMAAGA